MVVSWEWVIKVVVILVMWVNMVVVNSTMWDRCFIEMAWEVTVVSPGVVIGICWFVVVVVD